MDCVVSKLIEQVAEQLFKKHDRLGLNPWQGEESHISDYRRECWRSDARELIALITEANNAEWEAKLVKVRELHKQTPIYTEFDYSGFCAGCHPNYKTPYPCATTRALSEVKK